MYVIVDSRRTVIEAYLAAFSGEGVAVIGMSQGEFDDWLGNATPDELEAVEGWVIGEIDHRAAHCEDIRRRSPGPIIVLAEVKDLDMTLGLLGAGADDVVRKPVHVREIVARANGIWRRANRHDDAASLGRFQVYFDGRDIEIDGAPFDLPRRERHILEFLVRNAHRRVTKTQVFNAVYGVFEDQVDEVVVEGISKLRKKLRLKLGVDVVDARRYLGYQFVADRLVRRPAENMPARAGDEADERLRAVA